MAGPPFRMRKADRDDQVIAGIAAAESAADFSIARELFDEYARELGVDLCFQNFTSELANLDTMYSAPAGRLLLARGDGQIIGCVGVRRWSENACEMKRLYVRAVARGLGVGRRLAEASIEAARELGYETMLLDTLTTMAAAQDLYRSLGFRETASYYSNPLPQVTYMKLNLGRFGAA
jgi:ribosomal protein S18 acetylase RimI-like enzyme